MTKDRKLYRLAALILATLTAVQMSFSPKLVFASGGNGTAESYTVILDNTSASDTLISKYNLNDEIQTVKLDDVVIADAKLTESEVQKLENAECVLAVDKAITLYGCEESSVADTEELNQWYLNSINFVNDSFQTEKDVLIELIDSGVSYSESINNIQRYDLLDDEINVLFDDTAGHGTALAGIIGSSNNANGIKGMFSNAELLSVKVMDSKLQASVGDVAEAIYLGIDKGVDVINLSMGTSTDSSVLHQAVIDAYNAGILLIASAGNTGQSGVLYPAAYDEVMAVGSSDENGLQSDFTSTGDELELLAPGEKIITMGILDGVASTEGTSISAAEVSASAAILLSQEGSSRDLVRDLLTASSKNVANSSAGLLDIGYALEIYDDFSENYISENSGTYLSVNLNKPASYDANEIISGMWATDKHQYLVKNTSLSGSYLNAAMATVELADTKFGDTSNNHSGLHGWGNYYLNLKGIWMYANYIGNGKTAQEAGNLVTGVITKQSFKRDDIEDETKRKETIAKEYSYFINMINATEEMLNKRNNLGLSKYTTNGEKKYLVVGFAMHLLGDIYAHRSLIPDYAYENVKADRAESDSSSDHASRLGMSDFNDWEEVYELKGKLTGPELKKYMIPSLVNDKDNPVNRIYEDNVKFCRERFRASLDSCRVLYTSISASGNTFSASVIDQASGDNEINLVKNSVYRGCL